MMIVKLAMRAYTTRATLGLVEKRDQANDVDLFNDFFSLDDTSGVGSSH
jgi:hypothetical protein